MARAGTGGGRRTARTTVAVAAGILGAGSLGTGVAWACTLVPPPYVTGVLGMGVNDRIGVEDVSVVVVPRNAGSLSRLATPDGEPVETSPVEASPVPGLVRPTVPLSPGDAVVAPEGPCCSVVVVAGDEVDTTPPARPELVDGGIERERGGSRRSGCDVVESSCGDIVTMELAVASTADDQAPPERISYALFLGDSAQAASDADLSEAVFLSEPGTTPDTRRLWRFAAQGELDDEIWATVIALDQAGNASERSDPFPVNRPGGGCRVDSAALPTHTADLLLAVAAAFFLSARVGQRRSTG